MWFLLRALVALVAFLGRVAWTRQRPLLDLRHEGVAYASTLLSPALSGRRSRRHEVTIEAASSVSFDLGRETVATRFFKALRLTTELQTGDAAFDDRIFVTCDEPRIAQALGASAEARRRVMRVLPSSVGRIWSDGAMLRAHITKGRDERPAVEALFAVREATRGTLRVPDPFYGRALLLTALAWSAAGYPIGGFMEMQSTAEDVLLDSSAVVPQGVALGVVAFGLYVLLVIVLLRKSSRGLKTLSEGLIVAGLAAPFAGIRAVVDLNELFDTSKPRVFTATVTVKSVGRAWTSRRSRGPWRYDFRLTDVDPVPDFVFPQAVSVSKELYDALQTPGRVRLRVGQGALGHRWFTEKSLAPTP